MSCSLEDRVVLITGAGSGIGQMAAQAIAREGAKVVVTDLNVSGGEETVQSILDSGGKGIFCKADVTQDGEVEGLIEQIIATFGRLDGAFNNAGIGQKTFLMHETPESIFDQVIAVNLKGVFLCMKYELAQMVQQGHGSIVNTGSLCSVVGWKEEGVYTASKHGVLGLTRNAALEYASKGIRVNCVCPGPVLTPLSQYQGNDPEIIRKMYPIPMERRGTMQEVAEAIIWLLSDKSSYTTGHALLVDGGFVSR